MVLFVNVVIDAVLVHYDLVLSGRVESYNYIYADASDSTTSFGDNVVMGNDETYFYTYTRGFMCDSHVTDCWGFEVWPIDEYGWEFEGGMPGVVRNSIDGWMNIWTQDTTNGPCTAIYCEDQIARDRAHLIELEWSPITHWADSVELEWSAINFGEANDNFGIAGVRVCLDEPALDVCEGPDGGLVYEDETFELSTDYFPSVEDFRESGVNMREEYGMEWTRIDTPPFDAYKADIGFDFPYWCQNKNKVYISSEGLISFVPNVYNGPPSLYSEDSVQRQWGDAFSFFWTNFTSAELETELYTMQRPESFHILFNHMMPYDVSFGYSFFADGTLDFVLIDVADDEFPGNLESGGSFLNGPGKDQILTLSPLYSPLTFQQPGTVRRFSYAPVEPDDSSTFWFWASIVGAAALVVGLGVVGAVAMKKQQETVMATPPARAKVENYNSIPTSTALISKSGPTSRKKSTSGARASSPVRRGSSSPVKQRGSSPTKRDGSPTKSKRKGSLSSSKRKRKNSKSGKVLTGGKPLPPAEAPAPLPGIARPSTDKLNDPATRKLLDEQAEKEAAARRANK